MIRAITLTGLTLMLGLFFILVGQFKITSKFFPEIHDDMKHEFGRFNKVFPLYSVTGWRPYAKNYRLAVGLTELICGFILICISGRLRQLANGILLIIMLGAIYTHYALHDKFERMTPGLVFSLLLAIRLILSQPGRKQIHLKKVGSKNEQNKSAADDEKVLSGSVEAIHNQKRKKVE